MTNRTGPRLATLGLLAAGLTGHLACSSEPPAPEASPVEVSSQQAGVEAEALSRSEAGGNRSARKALAAPDVASPGSPALAPMLVTRTSLTLRVDAVEPALASLENLARTHGGYIEARQLSRGGQAVSAAATLRVPASRLDALLTGLRGLGSVLSLDASAEDVGGEVHDLGAQIRNWQAEERQLQALFARAGKIPELLEVERELSRVRGEIDRAAARLAYLRTQVALATIAVVLQEPAAPGAPVGWSAPGVFREALQALGGTLAALASLVIWGVVFSPLWGALLLAARWMWRRRPKRGESV